MKTHFLLALLATVAPALAQPSDILPPSAAASAKKMPPVWESSHFSFLPRAFQSTPHMDVMIVTEFTPAGRRAPAASPDHPVYYTGSDGGLVTVGEVIGGEEIPEASELARILVQALQVNGFQPADKAHAPNLFIHYRWGSFNRLPRLGGPPDDMDRINFIERAALVGGTKFADKLIFAMNAGSVSFFEDSSARNMFLVQEAHENRYFIIASAYDFKAALQGKIDLLWRTKISTNSRGITMNESLPQLVASAAPYLGVETDGPVRLDRPVVKAGSVQIGEATIKEDIPPDTARPPEAPEPGAPSSGQ